MRKKWMSSKRCLEIGILGFHFFDIHWFNGDILERGKSSKWACWDYLAKPKNVAVTRVLLQRREKTSSDRATPTQRNFAGPPLRCNLISSVSMTVWVWVLRFGYPAFPCCHLSVGTFVTTYGQQASAHLGLKTWDLIVSWLDRASLLSLPASPFITRLKSCPVLLIFGSPRNSMLRIYLISSRGFDENTWYMEIHFTQK